MVPEHPAFELHDSLSAVQQVIRSEDLKEGARVRREAQAGLEGQVSAPALAARQPAGTARHAAHQGAAARHPASR